MGDYSTEVKREERQENPRRGPLDGIHGGVSMSNWISVDERLPEYGTEVLVCLANGTRAIAYWHVSKCWLGLGTKLNHVTHWQPLPEPPEAGK